MAVTRASDADRDRCVEIIEAAFADGRLNDLERESRTTSALTAHTLTELERLTADLAPPAAPATASPTVSYGSAPPRTTTPSTPSTVRLRVLQMIVVGVVVVATALTIGLFALSGGGSTSGSSSAGQAATPAALPLHTAAGLSELADLTRTRFGTTTVASAAIYPDYASIEIVDKDVPRRTTRWYFKGDYRDDSSPSKSTRAADDVVVDLAAIDPTAYASAIDRAPAALGVEDIDTQYVVVGDTSGVPTYSVYVSNEYHETGYWTFTLDGTEVARHPYE